jgi:osmotically-inducible protein OsmY
MRKYGKWLLVLAVLAAVPAVASADKVVNETQRNTSASSVFSKEHNQRQAEQVKAALQEARIDGDSINIETIDGVVTLTGKVQNPEHKARAEQACKKISGVTKVVNNLKHVPRSSVRPASATLADLVKRSLRRDRTQADSPAIQQVIAEQPSTPSNQQVAEQIGGSLRQVGLAGLPIQVRFEKGIVTLNGTVESSAQGHAAAEAAGSVAGVKSVQNELAVSQASFQVSQVSAGPTAMAGPAAMGGAGMFSHPQLPSHAWPAYAQYPNSAAVTYPTQYSASAFPYIGPFYPYPQVPMGWRQVKLEWDDGFWNLNFNKKESVWDVLFNPSGK